MKTRATLSIALATGLLLSASCGKKQTIAIIDPTPENVALFTSSDKSLESTFAWAKKTALSYAHDNNDPVGPWYEAALPSREAFCMRDVAHQSVGAHILGLARQNSNMLHKFAENISESKDFCTYWEINRYNRPVPADYANEKEFWYNLNANFDIINACWKMYEWTGEESYLTDDVFRNFYSQSTVNYLDKWDLSPDKLMGRAAHMNVPENYNPSYQMHVCRGLPSYCENYPDITVGIDLVAALSSGFDAYSHICRHHGDKTGEEDAIAKAKSYRQIIDSCWWDPANHRFNTYLSDNGSFGRGEGVPHLLWFGGVEDPEKIKYSIADILSGEWNVENLSAFPYMLYQHGYEADAYKVLTSLPSQGRAEYPEVSYGLVEGIVCGAMGLTPSVENHSVSSLSRIGNHSARIENVPLWGGYVSLSHNNGNSSELTNNTGVPITWLVSFLGDYKSVSAGQNIYSACVSHDTQGNPISTASITVEPGETMTARVN